MATSALTLGLSRLAWRGHRATVTLDEAENISGVMVAMNCLLFFLYYSS